MPPQPIGHPGDAASVSGSTSYSGQDNLQEMKHGHRLFVVGLAIQVLAGPALFILGGIFVGAASSGVGDVIALLILVAVAEIAGLILTIVGITMFMSGSEDAIQVLMSQLESLPPKPAGAAGTVQGEGFYYTPAAQDRPGTR